jgi:hypothetical protein
MRYLATGTRFDIASQRGATLWLMVDWPGGTGRPLQVSAPPPTITRSLAAAADEWRFTTYNKPFEVAILQIRFLGTYAKLDSYNRQVLTRHTF